MNKNDYAKIGKLVAGGALVAVGLWRRSLFGMILTGVGGLVLQRTLRQKSAEKAEEIEPKPEEKEVVAFTSHEPSIGKSETEKKVTKEVPPEISAVHETDLDSVSEAETLDHAVQKP